MPTHQVKSLQNEDVVLVRPCVLKICTWLPTGLNFAAALPVSLLRSKSSVVKLANAGSAPHSNGRLPAAEERHMLAHIYATGKLRAC